MPVGRFFKRILRPFLPRVPLPSVPKAVFQTPGIRRMVGRYFGNLQLRLGMSLKRTADRMIERGYAIERVSISTELREIKGKIDLEDFGDQIPGSMKWPISGMSDVDLSRRYKYRVYGKMTLLDPRTGTEIEEWASFYTNDQLTGDQYTDMFDEQYGGEYTRAGLLVSSFETKFLEHNRRLPY